MAGIFDASIFVDLHRLPELFCGFSRQPGQGPTLYPVACAPQAWSAAAVFLFLEACLGLSINAREKQICFSYPRLPESIPSLRIYGLKVGNASVDLFLERHGHDVSVNVSDRQGDVRVLVLK
jgi:glycogen debranching enzyme